MNVNFVYEPDYGRVISATYTDSRSSVPEIKNKVGAVIKEYIDAQVSLVSDKSIVYKVESDLGTIAGFFVISVNTFNKTANLQTSVLRPSFKQYFSEISDEIVKFTNGTEWQQDYLF